MEPKPLIGIFLMDNMTINGADLHRGISLAVTTYSTQSYYTHACLEAIREWKNDQHELIVACHDQSLLLEFYLKACALDGLIDKLIFTEHSHGHTKGVNRCFEEATGEYLFNIANDILIGGVLVNDCAHKLADEHVGLIGWHWYNEGTIWQADQIVEYRLREEKQPNLRAEDEQNIRNAPWFTGRTFRSIGPKWLCLCNTGFFGIRNKLWRQLGGFSDTYRHYWADDFLNYAVLDQGLDVRNFDLKFRKKPYFAEFQYDNIDVEDRHRRDDRIDLPLSLADYTTNLEGGLSTRECQLLFHLARAAVIDHGLLIFHDYGQSSWPEIRLAIDRSFAKERIRCFETLAVVET